MFFNRPPRIQTPLPEKTISIPTPSDVPSKPSESHWIITALPLVALFLVMLLMLFGSSSVGLSYLLFMPLMLVTYLVSIINNRMQRKKYKEDLAKAKDKYNGELREVSKQIQSQYNQEREIRYRVDPSPSECCQFAKKRQSRLGERRLSDPDFLNPRLGLGSLPVSFEIEHPDPSSRIDVLEDEFKFIDELLAKFSSFPSAPITARLPQKGSIGFAGKRSDVLDVVRAFIGHIITHHWYNEVKVAAICKPGNFSDWKWLQLLPHLSNELRWRKMHPAGKEPPRELMASLEAELQRRERLVETEKTIQRDKNNGEESSTPLTRIIVVFDSLDVEYNHPGLTLLLKKGMDLGVYGIFITNHPHKIPGACGTLVKVKSGTLLYQETGIEGIEFECHQPDRIGYKQAETLAQALAHIQWLDDEDTSQPPERIGFLKMFGAEKVEDLDIQARWNDNSSKRYLKCPIGRTSATADLIFDLNDADGAHGPHGLIGGMTGSGKSEMLKTLILSLAVTHHPQDLNFALIDYKGGAAFSELAEVEHQNKSGHLIQLPHIVGVVTDIETNATYAERVLQALSGEIKRRKRILLDALGNFELSKAHVDEYRTKLKVKRPLPRLVIIFDEFAEFKQQHPEESKRLINIARQGRSLGVHLVLATQNIAAAIDPEILQNSSFRICLRVSETQDSIQMIGIPDAVNLNRGRAYFSSETRLLFQAAYAGGEYHADGDSPSQRAEIKYIYPGGAVKRLKIFPIGITDVNSNSEARAIVKHLHSIADNLKISSLQPVWPDPLPEKIHLTYLLEKYDVLREWDDAHTEWVPREQEYPDLGFCPPILGLLDQPAKQQQEILQLEPSKDGGNLLVFGSAGSGKSTLLRTLVVSLARTNTPAKVNIYALDFGGQLSLKILENFPHVGAIITRLENERTERLIHFLQTEIARRNDLFRASLVDNWIEYNSKQLEKLPALYFIIDGFRDFRQTFAERRELIDSVVAMVGGGQAVGLFLIITSSLADEVPESLSGNISARWTFHQAKQENYFQIVGRPSEAKKQEEAVKGMIPGRGLLRGTHPLEFQAALPVPDIKSTDDEITADHIDVHVITNLAEEMQNSWKGSLPKEIKTLPYLVTLPIINTSAAAVVHRSFWTMLGQDFDSLSPIGIALSESPAYLIADTSYQSGKTTLIQTWLISLLESYSSSQIETIIVDFHTRTLLTFKNCGRYINTKPAFGEVITWLSQEIQTRQERFDTYFENNPGAADAAPLLVDQKRILVIIDDYDRLVSSIDSEKQMLADCLTRGAELGVNFIVSGNASELPKDHEDPFIQRVRKQGSGILLGGTEGINQFNNARRPIGQPATGLPPGRGYIIKRGKAILFQGAVIWEKDKDADETLASRIAQLP
jgi:DNA segregation ATPase FtsK/SpoIIIE, S-DNA-T family